MTATEAPPPRVEWNTDKMSYSNAREITLHTSFHAVEANKYEARNSSVPTGKLQEALKPCFPDLRITEEDGKILVSGGKAKLFIIAFGGVGIQEPGIAPGGPGS